MPSMTEKWTDERLEGLLGTSFDGAWCRRRLVVALGAVVFLARHGSEQPLYQVFRGEPSDLKTVPGILRDAFTGRGRGLIQLGLLLLDRDAGHPRRALDRRVRDPARSPLRPHHADRPRRAALQPVRALPLNHAQLSDLVDASLEEG